MPVLQLTQQAVDSGLPVLPGRRATESCDAIVPGLTLQRHATSPQRGTWALRPKVAGKRGFHKIGSTDDTSLADARRKALLLKAELAESTPAPIKQRPLLSPIQAGGLASVFKVLANDTRLRLLHALVRADELCVSDLAASIGMKPQAVSNQLQRLSDLGILASRRKGNNVHYRVVDLCVRSLLDQGMCLMEEVASRDTLSRRMPR